MWAAIATIKSPTNGFANDASPHSLLVVPKTRLNLDNLML